MSVEIEWARTRLRDLRIRLEAFRGEMLALREALPPSAEEAAEHDLDPEADPDVATEFRNVLACTVHDNLEPLIRDLCGALEYQRRDGA